MMIVAVIVIAVALGTHLFGEIAVVLQANTEPGK